MKSKTVYVCSTCGYKSPKWLGKCPSCNAWNTLEEETEITEKPVASRFQRFVQGADNSAIPYSELELRPISVPKPDVPSLTGYLAEVSSADLWCLFRVNPE